jgi:hypothetical protein
VPSPDVADGVGSADDGGSPDGDEGSSDDEGSLDGNVGSPGGTAGSLGGVTSGSVTVGDAPAGGAPSLAVGLVSEQNASRSRTRMMTARIAATRIPTRRFRDGGPAGCAAAFSDIAGSSEQVT